MLFLQFCKVTERLVVDLGLTLNLGLVLQVDRIDGAVGGEHFCARFLSLDLGDLLGLLLVELLQNRADIAFISGF